MNRVLVTGLLTALLAGCEDRPSWDREPLGRDYFDSTGSYRSAGVSTRMRAELTPLEASSLHGDTLGRPFHLFRTRCASCHMVPDPTMKSEGHWPYLVRKMRERTERAGLMPMTEAEADSILVFLRTHARP